METRSASRSYIRDCIDNEGYAPTDSEITRALGLANRNPVVWHLGRLREQGRLDYVDGHRTTSLRLIR